MKELLAAGFDDNNGARYIKWMPTYSVEVYKFGTVWRCSIEDEGGAIIVKRNATPAYVLNLVKALEA